MAALPVSAPRPSMQPPARRWPPSQPAQPQRPQPSLPHPARPKPWQHCRKSWQSSWCLHPEKPARSHRSDARADTPESGRDQEQE
eukprot:145017-Amphidinium_carterae.1